MAAPLLDVMQAIGTQLETIDDVNVYDHPAALVAAPALVVSMPESVDFDFTGARGFDRTVFPIFLLVGQTSMAAARDRLFGFIPEVKAALEKNLDGECDSCRVTSCTFAMIRMNDVEYAGAQFLLEVIY